ncbi:MAG: hypothetical protein Q9201_000046 [Fulgogasparrea decipioides]
MQCPVISWVSVGLVALALYAASAAPNVHSPWQLPPQHSFGTSGVNASFDYVVIGGGTAGLTIASRLSENPRLRVAVVEQGGFYELDNGNLSTVPAYCTAFAGTNPNDTNNPLVDWGFVTLPQAGASNRRLHYAQGKTLGGSSARNFMVYHRPTIGSLQQWAEAVGDDAYTFPRLLPFYQKSPHYNPPGFVSPNSTNEQDPAAFTAEGGPLQLKSHGIATIKDLPGVGQNLWDHAFFPTLYPVNLPTNSAGLNDPTVQATAVSEYEQRRYGPLTIPAPGTLGWEKLPEPYRGNLSADARRALDSTFPSDWPELEFLPVTGTLSSQRNYKMEDPKNGQNYASIFTALVAPLSRGNITLNSATMANSPLINPNWLTHPADVELAIAGFKRQRDFWRQLANVTVGPEKIPGTMVQTDAQILNFIGEALAPVWHAAGTCKMGQRSDAMAVVDSSNKVLGVQNLRIVDASVFPLLPPGHPQSTVYALAEKLAAELLLLHRPSSLSTAASSRDTIASEH